MKEEIYLILISKRCAHKCPLCCNRLYDLDKAVEEEKRKVSNKE